jgi:hypothetical protein
MPQKRKTTTPKFISTPVRGPQVVIYEGETDTYSCKFELTEDEMKLFLQKVEQGIIPNYPEVLMEKSPLRKLQTRLKSVLHTIKLSRKNNNA